jgi:hypothetical protein
VHQIPTIPPGPSQFPTGGSSVGISFMVLYDRCFLVLRRETALLCHGGSRMIKSKRELLSVYVAKAEDAEGKVSRINDDRAGK